MVSFVILEVLTILATEPDTLILDKTIEEKKFVKEAQSFAVSQNLNPVTLDEINVWAEFQKLKDNLGCDDVSCYSELVSVGIKYVVKIHPTHLENEADLSIHDIEKLGKTIANIHIFDNEQKRPSNLQFWPWPPDDTDKDGISDHEDKCPERAGIIPSGCPRGLYLSKKSEQESFSAYPYSERAKLGMVIGALGVVTSAGLYLWGRSVEKDYKSLGENASREEFTNNKETAEMLYSTSYIVVSITGIIGVASFFSN